MEWNSQRRHPVMAQQHPHLGRFVDSSHAFAHKIKEKLKALYPLFLSSCSAPDNLTSLSSSFSDFYDGDSFRPVLSDFSGFPDASPGFGFLSSMLASTQIADQLASFEVGFFPKFNRRQCLLLRGICRSLGNSVAELGLAVEIFSGDLPALASPTSSLNGNHSSNPTSPSRVDVSSISDVKRAMTEINRLLRTSVKLVEDCQQDICSPMAMTRLHDHKAFEVILLEMELWWKELTVALGWIMGSPELAQNHSSDCHGRMLPGLLGALWKYALRAAAMKDCDEAFVALQNMVRRYTEMSNDEWDTEKMKNFQRARLLSGKLKYAFDESPDRDMDALYVDPSELTRGDVIVEERNGVSVHEVFWAGNKYAMKSFSKVVDRRRFQEEVSILAKLQHPNVVRLICHTRNHAENSCSLVMELLDESLLDLIKRKTNSSSSGAVVGPFKQSIAVRILLQIARAMQYLHEEDIMHRDLKAANILLAYGTSLDNALITGDFQVKVGDLGQAKPKASLSATNSGAVGTSVWRAPEVILAERQGDLPGNYTRKVDVYSFACTCYEVLTGKFPFLYYNRGDIFDQILKGERPDIHEFVHLPLANLVKRCWHKDPDSRPSFQEICCLLERCLIDVSSYEYIQ